MTAKGTPSAQDGHASYCRSYDANQKRLQETAMTAAPADAMPLACPFCGSPAGGVVHHVQAVRRPDGSTDERRAVVCSREFCGCMGHGPICSSEALAIAAWNRRAPVEVPQPLDAVDEAARDSRNEVVEQCAKVVEGYCTLFGDAFQGNVDAAIEAIAADIRALSHPAEPPLPDDEAKGYREGFADAKGRG